MRAQSETCFCLLIIVFCFALLGCRLAMRMLYDTNFQLENKYEKLAKKILKKEAKREWSRNLLHII